MRPVRLAVLGLGSFGRFVLDSLLGMDEVEVCLIASRSGQGWEPLGGPRPRRLRDYAEALDDPHVEAVYVATPPAGHGGLARAALEAGRPVLVEKPLALTLDEAEAVVALAESRGLPLAVHHLLRFSPLYRVVKTVCDRGLLGDLRHLALENHASDSGLEPGHWFWDAEASGTLVVEHGVHFFDVATWLSGEPGQVLAAAAPRRGGARPPEEQAPDRYAVTALYGETVATFYHAFDKPAPLERTRLSLTFDRGYLRVTGWVPLRLTVEAALERPRVAELLSLLGREGAARPGETWQTPLTCGGETFPLRVTAQAWREGFSPWRARWRDLPVDVHLRLAAAVTEDKEAVYRRQIRGAFRDFARSVREPGRPPVLAAREGLASLAAAWAARELAASSCVRGKSPAASL